jgi:hypothetical protein
MIKDALIAAAGGVVCAFFALGLATLRPMGVFFSFWAPLTLYGAGLAFGLGGVVIACAAAAVTMGLLHFLVFEQGIVGLTVFALNDLLPAGAVTGLALRNRLEAQGGVTWYPGGHILSWMAAGFAAAFLAWGLMVIDQGVEATILSGLERAFSAFWPEMDPADWPLKAGPLAETLPALLGLVWLAGIMVNGLTAQGMAARLNRNLRSVGPLAVLSLPHWSAALLIAGLALALIGEGDLRYMGANLSVVLAVPFVVQGLAVVHMFARKTSHPAALLTAFYGGNLVLGCQYSYLPAFVALALLGLIEQGAGLRKRFTAPHDWEFE